MAGRSRTGFRLVSLAAAAATLLASWLPPGWACACEAVGPTNLTATPTTEPGACPCCGKRPAGGETPRSCCPVPAKAAPTSGCDCGSSRGPAIPDPTAPPRPAHSDDGPAATPFAPLVDWAPVPAGPSAADVATQPADPPPIDLVISLSRLTC